MTTNPLYNALAALAYIILLVSGAFTASTLFGSDDGNIVMPMIMLSLLVLSVSVMAYLFFYRPVVLLLDGHREKAITLFLHTIAIFAVGVCALVLTALLAQ